MKPVVVIPTYNERENVEAMAAAVLANLPPDGQLLFLDDNSPDGTGAVIDSICAHEARVHVMHREKKEGLGRAYVAGFAEALRMGATHVIEMDCDFSHDPKDVPRLLAAVAGRPPYQEGGIFIRFMLGVPVKDPTGGFKCFTRRALELLGDFSSIKSFGYSFQMEMNYRMWQAGLKLVEVPITFSERRAGASKISGSIAVESLKMVFKLKFS